MKKIISTILAVALCIISAFTVVGCSNTKTFKVVFDTAGGTRVSGGAIVQTVSKAEEIIPPILEKEGYTFVDWDADLSGIDKDTTVKAVWEKNKFTVTFSVAEGTYVEGSGAAIQTVKSGQELVLPEYTRIGYTLSWDKDLKEITDTCTVNGIWTANEYKLSFLNADGSKIEGVEDLKVTYDQKIPALPKLNDGEQRFVGWKNSAGVPVSEGQVWKYDKDISVKAVWADYDEYIININLDGGQQMHYPNTYTVKTGAIINEAVKVGYTFLGWVETDENGQAISEPQIVINIGKGETGDRYYLATWQVKSYTVNFVSVEGNVNIKTMTFTYGQTITELPTVSDHGGTFVCWKYKGSEIKVGEQWLIDESGIEVNAEFIRKFIFNLILSRKVGTEEIKVALRNGASNKIVIDEYSPITLPLAEAEKSDDYAFLGWKYKNNSDKYVKLASNTIITQTAFADLDFSNKLTIEIDLVAFCSVKGVRKFVVDLKTDGFCGNKPVQGLLKEGEPTKIELDENTAIKLINATPKDTNEYRFSNWKYKNDKGDWVVIKDGTVLNQENLPDIDVNSRKTINIELVAFYASNWTGFY